jgi:hypothetical protein
LCPIGTSHKYIPDSVSVYLCIHVANGIAKKTEDFLDALYGWAAGPLELLWLSFFNDELKHHIITLIPILVSAMACFGESGWWYMLYLLMVAAFAVQVL